ncbi:hypothetical protein ACN28C_22990 [Plantactinospora sp. WMMC1484]|uniref:hypothetical protein n=1 Tax=Plantactinospora sp. WMMC1484 TaxID=3404122 RepID=UPI003BF4B68E
MIRSRALTGFAAIAVAVLGVVSTTQPATAGEAGTQPVISGTSTVAYNCVEEPYPGGDTTFDVTFSAPLAVRVGSKVTLRAAVRATVTIPIDVPANGVDGSVEALLSGSQSGVVTATGLTNTAIVPAGELMTLTGGTATVTPTARGVLRFTPGVLESTNWLGQHLVCTPTATPATAIFVLVG